MPLFECARLALNGGGRIVGLLPIGLLLVLFQRWQDSTHNITFLRVVGFYARDLCWL
jgi:hypothetical protein